VFVPIRSLPPEVASAIAAGEVVERPASVVKELVENSLDAGARRIEITVEKGGRKLIEVVDDGDGIPAAEIALAVNRYSTSKLERAEDLFAIQTLGFRGEALSSIGAVSRLELVSHTASEQVGSRLIVEGGISGKPQSAGGPKGSVIRVRDIFYNVPARQKFLKSETTERRRINSLITRYALAYPHVAFRLEQEGRESFRTTGNGNQREILATLYGVEVARQMICLPETEGAPIQVHGFIGPPGISRSNRRELTFFVNGRWIQDGQLAAAVIQAYHALLMVGRYPLVVLFLTMPPEAVDVNVHPTKATIRFSDARLVFSIVQRVVRASLLGQAPAPDFKFEGSTNALGWTPATGSARIGWIPTDETDQAKHGAGDTVQTTLPGSEMPLLRAVGQFGASYLVAEGPDGLYLIDQHAAHERVLFEKLMIAVRDKNLESQRLLEPDAVELSPSQTLLLTENLEVLSKLGFEVEPFGRSMFRVRAMPAILSHLAPAGALKAVVEDFEEDEAPLEAEVEARIAARVCKRASVKAGQVLSLSEQQELLRALEQCESPRTCPHGRPTMIRLSMDALEKQFGRRG
jgi:DNA mismatch repair protein MutL